MSILGSIFSKILGRHDAVDAVPAANSTTASRNSVSPSGTHSGSPASDTTPTPPTAAGPAPATPPASGKPITSATADAGQGAVPAATVDVGAILNGLAAQHRDKLDWKHSIVDMMKLLDLDSSLASRQALARELHYTGDLQDSGSMNVWLHKQVMLKLAQNGGKLPDDLGS